MTWTMLLRSKMNTDGYPWAPTYTAVSESCGSVPGTLRNLLPLLSHMPRLVRSLEANILIPQQSELPARVQVSLLYCGSLTECREGRLNPRRREEVLPILRLGFQLSWVLLLLLTYA